MSVQNIIFKKIFIKCMIFKIYFKDKEAGAEMARVPCQVHAVSKWLRQDRSLWTPHPVLLFVIHNAFSACCPWPGNKTGHFS